VFSFSCSFAVQGDLFHDASGGSAVSNGKVEWVSATMMEDLFVAKVRKMIGAHM
jgi:hypothetical protein